MLKRLQKSMDEKDEGFTLIELLVVVIIIGILAGIAIPVFLNQRKKGVDASMRSDARNAATTVETWITDNPTTAVPNTALAANAAAPTTGPLAGFRASSGNTISVTGSSTIGAYCIDVGNSASSAPSGTPFVVYKSSTGGLVSGFQAACTP